jgi:uracil-DNA glycosylase
MARGNRDGDGAGTAAPLVPAHPTLPAPRQAAAGCRACPLWERGTPTVFGEGAPGAEVVLVGEQPGNEEDLAGHPFVGPAGRLLDRALAEAGIDRRCVHVTNAVKNFKWKARGKRVMATAHPSSILRAPDDEWRRAERERLIEDLARLAEALRASPPEAEAPPP